MPAICDIKGHALPLHLTLEFRDISPEQIAAEVISLLRVKAKEKDLALEFTLDPGAPQKIVSDPTRVRHGDRHPDHPAHIGA